MPEGSCRRRSTLKLRSTAFPATELPVADVLRSAAYAAACSGCVFYLFGKEAFEVAASFGLSKPVPNVPIDNQFLSAGRFHEDVLILGGPLATAELSLQSKIVFGNQPSNFQFAAMVRVFCGSAKACGLLVLADASPRTSVSAQHLCLIRSHADQLSTLIELYMLRDSLLERRIEEPRSESSTSRQKGFRPSRLMRNKTENYVLDSEVDSLKRVRDQLFFAAFHDDLTMLHNRQFFMDRLMAAFEKATSSSDFRFAILLIDLDRFKLVNDKFGHRAGDLLLIHTADRLRACTRPNDVLARIGGDEFALLVEGLEETRSVEALAQRLIQVVRDQPQGPGIPKVASSCSIGIVQATENYRVPEDLLHDADLAMYHAKRENAGYALFAHSMQGEALKQMQMRTDLQKAVARKEFYLEYQPICRSATAEVIGLEALIRWQHPRQGVMLPGLFISAAEEFGFIRQIGSWVLQEACAQMCLWKVQYPEVQLRLNVNVSGEQLKDEGFAVEVNQVLVRSGLSPKSLQLEVTESVMVEKAIVSEKILGDIKSGGVTIALDDFGTGYSSLSYLDRYPIDVIKIDKSFTSGIQTRSRTTAIVKAILDLADALGLEVIAEGVEDDAQLEALSSMSCKYVQGFLLSPPMSPSQITRMLKTQGSS